MSDLMNDFNAKKAREISEMFIFENFINPDNIKRKIQEACLKGEFKLVLSTNVLSHIRRDLVSLAAIKIQDYFAPLGFIVDQHFEPMEKTDTYFLNSNIYIVIHW